MTPGPDKIKAGEPEGKEGEPFLSRWARRKEEARSQPQELVRDKAGDAESPAPALPPIDQLTPESDFRAFFHPKVDESVRRAALKKLFTDPHFNVMDGLDTYIDDYSKTEPIPAAMMAGLRQAQNILGWAKEDEEERKKKQLAQIADATPATIESPTALSLPQAGVQTSAADAVPAAPEPPPSPPSP